MRIEREIIMNYLDVIALTVYIIGLLCVSMSTLAESPKWKNIFTTVGILMALIIGFIAYFAE